MLAVLLRAATIADADACARLALEPPGGLHLIVGDPGAREEIARRTFLARGTGFGWERSLVATGPDGRVVGLAARFPGRDWPKLRLKTGMVMLSAAGARYAVPLIRRGRLEERTMAPIAADRMYVMALAVDPGWRGSGVGVVLLDRVSEEARAGALRAVALDVLTDNEAAVRFYRREGFAVASEATVPSQRGMPEVRMLRMERGL